MKKILAVVLSMFLLAGTPAPVNADCCDDIFSCAAAVVTDGLSCVVLETISVVKHLLGIVSDAMDNITGATQSAGRDAVQQVNDTIALFKSQSQQSKDQFATAEQLAATIYNQEANGRLVAARNPDAGGEMAANRGSTGASNYSGPAVAVASSTAAPGTATAPAPAATAKRTTGKAISSNAVRSTGEQPIAAAKATPSPVLGNAQKLNAAASQQSAGVVGPSRPLAGTYSNDFSRAASEIKQLKLIGEQDFLRVASSMQAAAIATDIAATKNAVSTAEKAINAPLRVLTQQLEAMLKDPSNIFDPSAVVNANIAYALSNVDTSIHQMVETITAGPQREFVAAQNPYTELQSNALRAAQIAAAMDTLHKNRSPEALDALNKLLPKSAASTAGEKGALAGLLISSSQLSHIQIMSKFSENKLKVAGPPRIKFQDISTGVTQLKTLQIRAKAVRASVPALQANLSQKMNTYFTGKSAVEIASERDQLIAQARTRFANDPKTRDAVIHLFTMEAGKREAMRRH